MQGQIANHFGTRLTSGFDLLCLENNLREFRDIEPLCTLELAIELRIAGRDCVGGDVNFKRALGDRLWREVQTARDAGEFAVPSRETQMRYAEKYAGMIRIDRVDTILNGRRI